MLDRIDIHIRVPRVKYDELTSVKKAESSASIRERVVKARKKQQQRLQKYGIYCNAQMNHAILKQECQLTQAAQTLLEQAFKKLKLSARSYDRIIKVAQTIADLKGLDQIDSQELAEAVQLRNDLGLNLE